MLAACPDSGGSAGARGWRLEMCAALIEAEALPQAARWHRRDLVPAAAAVLRAVLRAVRRTIAAPAGPAASDAAAAAAAATSAVALGRPRGEGTRGE